MYHHGYTSCKANPDLWMQLSKVGCGSAYYEYILLYVDYDMCIYQHHDKTLDRFGEFFTLKPGSVGPSKIYLGYNITQLLLPNVINAWGVSARQYIQEDVNNVEGHLRKSGMYLWKGSNSALMKNYWPECDVTSDMNETDSSYYMSLIGILRCIVEMG